VLRQLLQVAETAMVAGTLGIGLVATGYGALMGTEPMTFHSFYLAVQPPYEHDDKRIYGEDLNIPEDVEMEPAI
tara:strand:- start:570 stop:791 length:222 start_codon:yes stop_codon:yes gene_type:complete